MMLRPIKTVVKMPILNIYTLTRTIRAMYLVSSMFFIVHSAGEHTLADFTPFEKFYILAKIFNEENKKKSAAVHNKIIMPLLPKFDLIKRLLIELYRSGVNY